MGKWAVLTITLLLLNSNQEAHCGSYPDDAGGPEVTTEMQEQYRSLAGPPESFIERRDYEKLRPSEHQIEGYETPPVEDRENIGTKYEDISEYSRSISPRMEIDDQYAE